uniref:BCL2 associated athanogene 4 n=1 Tax=Tetraodon nigroviridis TaxID=99883 RepID=H3BY68_TETNG
SFQDAPQYPGYHSQYWYPQSQSTGHYTSTYPAGSDVRPPYGPRKPPHQDPQPLLALPVQVLAVGYPSAVYSPVQAHFHPSNPFYGADPQRPSPGPFPGQGCPAEPGGGSGYAPGTYPQYSESAPTPPYPTSPPLPPSCQADTWSHPGGYGPSQQPWQPGQNQYVRPAHPPAWPGTGSGAPPPYQAKVRLPGRSSAAHPTETSRLIRRTRGNRPSTSAEISSPPQIYPRTRGPQSHPAAAPSPGPEPGPGPGPGQAAPQAPGLARVQEVMSRVLLLQEDVEEFVGRKTDKSYRCLEELLTKELLVLDSVETGGQETLRQARKEAVQRIQAILDRLEKKAF